MSIGEGDEVIDRIEEGEGDLEKPMFFAFIIFIELAQLVPPSLSISELIDSESVSLKKRLPLPLEQLPLLGDALQERSVGSSDGDGEPGG